MASSDLETARALVLEGWAHLRAQRPLAAWASWRRALGYAPDLADARQALTGLEQSPQLPASARTALKFEPPGSPSRRRRWDAQFRRRDLEDLNDAALAFATLAGEDDQDAAAWANHATCLAWLGRNVEAVAALDRVVALRAESQPDRAVAAWALAGILRQGAGAETLADDLAYAWMLECRPDEVDDVLARLPVLVPVTPPVDPQTGAPQFPGARAFTWLDRPMPAAAEVHRAGDLPRVLAQIMALPGVLRLSSPDPVALDRVIANLRLSFGTGLRPIRREATPLPIVLLDAAVWNFRLPEGLDPEVERRVAREAIEELYENHWIHQPLTSLGGQSPLAASRQAREGDAVVRIKLAAVVLGREQLGARPWTAPLYHGYPFDRLRRRLGLAVVDPASIDSDDPSCMSPGELARLDPAALEVPALTEAFESASALRDDALAARFAAELTRRNAPTLARLDASALIATLVREAMRNNAAGEALDWLDQARDLHGAGARDRRTFDIWSAEIHARTGAPAAALRTYQEILDQSPADLALAFDAAETLLDQGYIGHARPLLLHAVEQARRAGDLPALERAEVLLERTTLEPTE